jgi:tetratricopeptide (TPR) repeat protein
VPFTLTIADVTSGHLQAVIGYDEPTRVLRIRDPSIHHTLEMNAAEFFDAQQSVGPRGMAMVPVENEDLLEGLALPEADLYDVYHAMQLELEAHDRSAAVQHYERMVVLNPGHRLTLTARRALAGYDANAQENLAAIDALLELYPDDQSLLLSRLFSLRELATRRERLDWLDAVFTRRHVSAPLFLEYAAELATDDRNMDQAMWLCRRALRRRPGEPRAMHLLAGLYWNQERSDEAIRLFRLAACGDDRNEAYALSYFAATRWLGRADTGLAFLRDRWERLGDRASQPVMTLFEALCALDRVDEALGVLENALLRRPDDGELDLFAANRYAMFGDAERAAMHLSAAQGQVRQTAWLGQAAAAARLAGNRQLALSYWADVLELEPLDLAAHRMTALLHAETSGRRRALEHLSSFCERFPHHAGLLQLSYELSSDASAAQRESFLRKLLEIDPSNAWALRELALNLQRQGRFDDALEAARDATRLDVSAASGHAIMGHALVRCGRVEEAATSYRRCIEHQADSREAIRGLLRTCGNTVADTREALRFLEEQLMKQALFGDGFLEYRHAARGILPPGDLLAVLQHAYAERPDAWSAYSALVNHLVEMGNTDEALRVATQATESFSKLPGAWLDLSRVHRRRREVEAQVVALDRARELNPEWPEPIHNLCDVYEQSGRFQESRQLLERCIKLSPLAAALRGRLAHVLHRSGEVDRAIAVLEEAVRIEPDYEWAWESLARFSAERGKPSHALDLARSLAESLGETRAWVRLAKLELSVDTPEASLESLERAIRINPRSAKAHDQRAVALAQLRRFEDAEAACRPAAFGERVPLELQGRAAWLDAQRGDLDLAIERIRTTVKENPDYTWGWQCLLEWYAAKERFDDAAEAAERLAWLEPDNAVPVAWEAEMRSGNGDRERAKDLYQRAMRMDPAYLFAGSRYFNLQLEDRELDEAERTLEVLSLHASDEETLAARIQLAVKRSEKETALELLRRLCRRPEAEQSAIGEAVMAMDNGGLSGEAERALHDLAGEEVCNAAVPGMWMGLLMRRGHLGSLRDYLWLRRLGPGAATAVHQALDGLGETAAKAPEGFSWGRWQVTWRSRIIRILFRDWRETDITYWAKMGWLLLTRRQHRAARRWLDDWARRPDAEPWMLQNVAIVCLQTDADRQAREVLRYMGHRIDIREELPPLVKLWCVVGACLDGNSSVAGALLHETPSAAVEGQYMAFRSFGELLVDVLSKPRGPLTESARDRWKRLQNSEMPDRATLRLFMLGKYALARHTRRIDKVVSTWIDLHRSRSFFMAVALFVVLLRLIAALG